MLTAEPRTRLRGRAGYERTVEAGILQPGERLELLDGEIVTKSPEKIRHAASVDLAHETLRRPFGLSFSVRAQHPLALDDSSAPEPDVALVVGSARACGDAHRRSAVLVVEVSDTSLSHDRTRKLAVYARAVVTPLGDLLP